VDTIIEHPSFDEECEVGDLDRKPAARVQSKNKEDDKEKPKLKPRSAQEDIQNDPSGSKKRPAASSCIRPLPWWARWATIHFLLVLN
jgi:hypothetical protein